MADADLVKDFVVDSLEFLDTVEPQLIELQLAAEHTGHVDESAVNAVFRLFHSLKGTAGFLALSNLVALTHAAETLLDCFRTGKLLPNRENVALVFRSLDLNRIMLQHIAEHYEDSTFEAAVQDLVREFTKEITGAGAPAGALAVAPGSATAIAPIKAATVPQTTQAAQLPKDCAPTTPPDFSELQIPITPEMVDNFVKESLEQIDQFEKSLLSLQTQEAPEQIQQAFRAIHSFKGNCGFMALPDLGRLSHKLESILERVKDGTLAASAPVVNALLEWVDVLREGIADVAKGGKGLISNCDLLLELIDSNLPSSAAGAVITSSAPCAVQPVPSQPKPTVTADVKPELKATEAPKAALMRQDIRVDLRKLDSLIDLVGELVVAEAMVTRNPVVTAHEDEGVSRAIHQLRRVSRDLQSVAMSVRMIPLAGTLQKMVRLVHDLAAKSGKKVALQLQGEETEVDKTVIEQIGDPLVHIVRNALDHGLELPDVRLAAGKGEEGHLTIEGRNEGGEVWIIIRDDGRGLNRERILQKAIEKGFVTGDGKDLEDSQVFKFIFEPGFSTAEKVTDVSGRGVGMDVVKRNIEKLKGRIDISSEPGKGATFILRIPLTLAIIEGMLVRVGTDCYTLPLLSIRESLRPEASQITITPDGQEVVRLRQEFVPIVRLHQLFRRKSDYINLHEGILVILESDTNLLALFVDEILGQQETVIKGLSAYVSGARCVSGCTILGDGQVSLILDIAALAHRAAEAKQTCHAPAINLHAH